MIKPHISIQHQTSLLFFSCSKSTRNKFSSLAIAVHKELAVFTQSWMISSSLFIQSQATYTADSMPSLLMSSRCSPAVNPSHSWSDSIFTSFKGKLCYWIMLLLKQWSCYIMSVCMLAITCSKELKNLMIFSVSQPALPFWCITPPSTGTLRTGTSVDYFFTRFLVALGHTLFYIKSEKKKKHGGNSWRVRWLEINFTLAAISVATDV